MTMGHNTRISDAKARIVFDSRGDETIEVEVSIGNISGTASAPSGKSRGIKEVVPYPEGGVKRSLEAFNKLVRPRLLGIDAANQSEIDIMLREIDGTENFSNIGGNLAIATSIATAIAASKALGIPLFQYIDKDACTIPLPLGNVIGGGKHAGTGAPDYQEILVVPLNPKDVLQAASTNILVHKELGRILQKKLPRYPLGKGDEGAYAPSIDSIQALDIVKEAVENVSNAFGIKIGIGLDIAASSLWDERKHAYVYQTEGRLLSREEHIARVIELAKSYQIIYLEDPVEENDYEGFAQISKECRNVKVCADDLTTTNADFIKKAAELGAANAVIIKPNQVGTLTDTLKACKVAQSYGMLTVASHRSGDTPDAYLAHIAVGARCKLIKSGVVGGERVAKMNELLRISELLDGKVRIASLG